jgi:hypothetical protein
MHPPQAGGPGTTERDRVVGTYTFNVEAAYERIVAIVGTGLSDTADEILVMAKDLAPVRKQGRRKKRTTTIGGVRAKHEFPVGRSRSVSVTGGQMYAAYKKLSANKGTLTRAEFRQAKMFDRGAARKQVVSPEDYDERAANASSGKPRGIARGSELGGTLKRGIERDKQVERVGTKLSVEIRSTAKYSRWVEFPTRRTAAQPFLLPAFKAARPRLKANIKAAKGG